MLVMIACTPAIPHSIDGRDDCISCHGQNKVKPFPQWHAKRNLGNDNCKNCHDVKINNHK